MKTLKERLEHESKDFDGIKYLPLLGCVLVSLGFAGLYTVPVGLIILGILIIVYSIVYLFNKYEA